MTRRAGLDALLYFVVAAVASGCMGTAPGDVAPMSRYTLEHDGFEREYFVFLPSDYSDEGPHPVAFFLHGYGGTATATEAEVTNGLTRYAEKYGYVMVFPQSTWFMSPGPLEERWEVTSWNHISDGFDNGPDGPICAEDAKAALCPPECGTCGRCGWTSCHDDIGFMKKLIARVSRDFAVDAGRVYVSGFSNGAMMAHRMACEASELFAAVALVGGRLERGFECTPTKPLPLLQMNGGADDTVPNDGRPSSYGYFFSSTRATETHWNDGKACASEPQSWSSETIAGHGVQCTIACGATDHPSIDCLWHEGNHRWPGTPGFRGSNGYCVTELQAASMPEQIACIAPDPQEDPWGSRLLFEFFDRHH